VDVHPRQILQEALQKILGEESAAGAILGLVSLAPRRSAYFGYRSARLMPAAGIITHLHQWFSLIEHPYAPMSRAEPLKSSHFHGQQPRP
jgi:hypothetical protein